jgi:hypothetical protein
MTIHRREFIEGVRLVAGSAAVTGVLVFAGESPSPMVARW